MAKYMTSCINYKTQEEAIKAFQQFIEDGRDAVLTNHGLSITLLQDKPVQVGQVEWRG